MAFSRELTGLYTCLLQKKCYHVFMLLVATTTLNTVSLMIITRKALNHVLMKKLKNGAFVRHIPGITYNATWTDMLIESTYMRLGHGTGRLERDGYMGSKFCHMWRTYS